MAKTYITKEEITEKETQVATEISCIRILPQNKSVEIILNKVYLDTTNKELRVEVKGNVIYQDREAGEEPAVTAYTDFLVSAGIDVNKVVLAMK